MDILSDVNISGKIKASHVQTISFFSNDSTPLMNVVESGLWFCRQVYLGLGNDANIHCNRKISFHDYNSGRTSEIASISLNSSGDIQIKQNSGTFTLKDQVIPTIHSYYCRVKWTVPSGCQKFSIIGYFGSACYFADTTFTPFISVYDGSGQRVYMDEKFNHSTKTIDLSRSDSQYDSDYYIQMITDAKVWIPVPKVKS